MILGRLSVRQKLSLLLAIPLTMVVLLAVPFLADRIDDARTAGATAGSAEVARAAGALVQDVQRERLLSMGYLATPEANRSAVVLASQAVRDRVLQLRADLGRRVTEPLSLALTGVGELSRLRPGILDRTVAPEQVYDAFGAAIGDVVNALALPAQQQSDVAGGRQLGALDGLLRADEASSSIGAAFVLTALDAAGPARVAEATTLRRLHAERFRSLAAPGPGGAVPHRRPQPGRSARRRGAAGRSDGRGRQLGDPRRGGRTGVAGGARAARRGPARAADQHRCREPRPRKRWPPRSRWPPSRWGCSRWS